MKPALLFAALLLAPVGCRGAEEDDGPSFVPKAVAFEGRIDPAFVGAWTSSDGRSSLDLGKDGRAKIALTTTSRNGKATARYEGRWRVSGSDLVLRYAEGTAPKRAAQATTVAYGAKLSGDALVLRHGSTETPYARRPAPAR